MGVLPRYGSRGRDRSAARILRSAARRQYGWHHRLDLWRTSGGPRDRASVVGCQSSRAGPAPPAPAVVAGRYVLLDQVGCRRHGVGLAGVGRADPAPRRAQGARPAQLGAARPLRPRAGGAGAPPARRRAARLGRRGRPGGAGHGAGAGRLGRRPAARARSARPPAPQGCCASSCSSACPRCTAPGSCTATSSPPTCCSRRPATGRRTCGSATSASPPRSRTAASPPSRARSAPTATWRPSRREARRPTPTQDLYAVGRVVLEMVTGLPPARPARGPVPPAPAARRAAAGDRSRAAPRDCRRGAAAAPPAAAAGRRRSAGARPARAAAARTSYDPGLGTSTGRAGRLWPHWSPSWRAVCASS